MSRRTLVGAAAVTAVVVVVGLTAAGVGAWRDVAPTRDSSDMDTSRSPSGTSHNGVTDGEGSEVIRQPEGSAATGLPGLRPAERSAKGSLITGRLPRTASSRGGVVAGFPTDVIPMLSGSVVHSTGVSSSRKVLQVSIVANSSRSPGNVLGSYRTILSALGFRESTAPAAGGSTAASFRRGSDSVMVTTTRMSRTDTRYYLFGTLHSGTSD